MSTGLPDPMDEIRGELAQLPCFLLYIGWRRAQALYRPVTGTQSPQRVYALSLVCKHEELTVTTLARAMDLDVASASGLLSRMEKDGIVTRSRSEKSRSVVLVRPTSQGKSLFEDLMSGLSEIDERLLAGLSKSNLNGLRAIVQQLGAMLEDRQ